MYITEYTQGTKENNIVVMFFSRDWKKSFEKEVTKAEFKKLKARKTIELVSWMQVLTNSNEKSKRGTFAPVANTLTELKGN